MVDAIRGSQGPTEFPPIDLREKKIVSDAAQMGQIPDEKKAAIRDQLEDAKFFMEFIVDHNERRFRSGSPADVKQANNRIKTALEILQGENPDAEKMVELLKESKELLNKVTFTDQFSNTKIFQTLNRINTALDLITPRVVRGTTPGGLEIILRPFMIGMVRGTVKGINDNLLRNDKIKNDPDLEEAVNAAIDNLSKSLAELLKADTDFHKVRVLLTVSKKLIENLPLLPLSNSDKALIFDRNAIVSNIKSILELASQIDKTPLTHSKGLRKGIRI